MFRVEPLIASAARRAQTLHWLVRVGIVLAGYAGAVLLAIAAVAIRIAYTSGPEAQASSGMYAFGDGLLFLLVFGAAATVPTGLALLFMRGCPRFWSGYSLAALAITATNFLALLIEMLLLLRPQLATGLGIWGFFVIARLLVAPGLAAAFALSAMLAPDRQAHRRLLIAMLAEGIGSALALLLWFGTTFIGRSV